VIAFEGKPKNKESMHRSQEGIRSKKQTRQQAFNGETRLLKQSPGTKRSHWPPILVDRFLLSINLSIL